MPIGSICVDLTDDASSLEVAFESSEGWALVTTEFWVGDNVTSVSFDEDEALDVESFPYYCCNSTGTRSHTTSLDFKWGYLCEEMEDFALAVVAQIAVGKVSQNGTEYDIDLGEDSFGWFDVPVVCECEPKEKTMECTDGEPTMANQKCQEVLAGDSMPIGSICVDLTDDSSSLEVTIESSEGWALVTTEFWVGDNVTIVPFDKDEALNVESFPYYWCNSTGARSHTSSLDFKWGYLCNEMEDFALAVVAQITVGKVSPNGKAIEGTEVVSFASEYDIDLEEDSFGWFDVPVVCECELKEKTMECTDGEPTMVKQECQEVLALSRTSPSIQQNNSFAPNALLQLPRLQAKPQDKHAESWSGCFILFLNIPLFLTIFCKSTSIF